MTGDNRDTSSKARGYERVAPGIYRRGASPAKDGKPAKPGRLMASYKGADGRQRWVTGRTLSEVKALREDAIAAVRNGKSMHVKRRMRLETYAKQWLETYEGRSGAGMEGTTMRNHRQRIDAHINRLIGKIPLSEITLDTLDNFKRDMQAYRKPNGEPLAPASIASVLKTLVIILRTAYRDRYIANDATEHFSTAVGANKAESRIHDLDDDEIGTSKVLSREELVRAIAVHEDGSWQRLAFRILAATGLRIGELSALTYADVKLYRGHWHVTVTKAWSDDLHEMKPPKNKTSRRRIPISEGLAADIASHRAASVWADDDDFLFPQPRNRAKPMGRSRIGRAVFAPIAVALERRVTPHMTRHTWVSHRIADGMTGNDYWTVARVSEKAGHANSRITWEIYNGADPTSKPSAVDI